MSPRVSVAWERVRAVSWDLDGTLYDMPLLRSLLRWRALGRALAPSTWRDLGAITGLRRAMDAVRAQGGDLSRLRLDRPLDVARAAEARWLVPTLRELGPRAGVVELRAALAARGLAQVVITDHPAKDKLAALGLDFSRVVVGEELGWLKPSPRPFVAAADALGLAPAELLHIGDREDADGAGARAAGCQVVVLGPGPGDLLKLASS